MLKHALSAIVFLFIVCSLFSQNEPDSIDYNAQRQMVATTQFTAPYRFGNDLKVGDYVKYYNEADSSVIEVKVLKEEKGTLLIQEKFDGNEVLLTLDKTTLKVTDLKGYDIDRYFYQLELLSDAKIQSELQSLQKDIQMSQGMFMPESWKPNGFQTLKIGTKNRECQSFKPIFSKYLTEKSSKTQLESLSSKFTFATNPQIPMLIPVKISLMFLNEYSKSFRFNGGLAQFGSLKLIAYSKKGEK